MPCHFQNCQHAPTGRAASVLATLWWPFIWCTASLCTCLIGHQFTAAPRLIRPPTEASQRVWRDWSYTSALTGSRWEVAEIRERKWNIDSPPESSGGDRRHAICMGPRFLFFFCFFPSAPTHFVCVHRREISPQCFSFFFFRRNQSHNKRRPFSSCADEMAPIQTGNLAAARRVWFMFAQSCCTQVQEHKHTLTWWVMPGQACGRRRLKGRNNDFNRVIGSSSDKPARAWLEAFCSAPLPLRWPLLFHGGCQRWPISEELSLNLSRRAKWFCNGFRPALQQPKVELILGFWFI